jgi:predicted phage terminase large subunit-like protein
MSDLDLHAFEQRLRQRFKPEQLKAQVLGPLMDLVPLTCELSETGLKPRLTRYLTDPIKRGVLRLPTPKQAQFLMLDVEDAYYGGAAGGGKSVALLMAFAQFADQPGYSGLILRRTFAELKMPGALMDLARQWWTGIDGVSFREGGTVVEFQTKGAPARLSFGYLENLDDKLRYQSAQFQFIGLDEATMFLESDFRFMFSRLRRAVHSQVPMRMRSASNPNGPGRLWVKQRYVDPTTREPGKVFIPASIDDNAYLDRESYKANLTLNLGPIEAAQLLHGDWEAQAAGKFRRHWFKIVDAVPSRGAFVRYWDLAASEDRGDNDPSWTAGVLLGCTGKEYYLADIRRDRLTPGKVEELVKQTAVLDGPGVRVRMEQEPGSAGVKVIEDYTTLLAGYDFKGDKVTGPRDIRANGFASQAEAGNVFLVKGAWNKIFLDECDVFPGGGHDDTVVAASGAFNELTGVPPVDTKTWLVVGRTRLKPDWNENGNYYR